MKTHVLLISIFSLLFVTDLQAQQLYTLTKKFNHPSYHANNYKHPNKAAATSRMNRQWHNPEYEMEREGALAPSNDYYKIPEPNAIKPAYVAVQRLHTTNPFVNSNNYKSQFKGRQPGKKSYVRKQEDFLVEGDFPETQNEQ